MEKIYTIPIYDCTLFVIVTKKMAQARNGFASLFGKFDATGLQGLSSYDNRGTFAMFFEGDAAQDISIVAHEVFHTTHRILEWATVKHDKDNHESGALLCGYLMKLVMEALNPPKKVKVKNL